MAIEPKIAIARILADLNLAVRYGITVRIIFYASRKFWLILIWQLILEIFTNVGEMAKNFPGENFHIHCTCIVVACEVVHIHVTTIARIFFSQ